MSTTEDIEPPKRPKNETNSLINMSTATQITPISKMIKIPKSIPKTHSSFSNSPMYASSEINSTNGDLADSISINSINNHLTPLNTIKNCKNGVLESLGKVDENEQNSSKLTNKSSSEGSIYSYPEMRFKDEWVKLNVGGTLLISTRMTLSKYSHENVHFLAALIANPCQMDSFKDKTGAYLIDRNPETFKHVINFLRTGTLNIPSSEILDGVLVEAEFCNLRPLINLCQARIEQRKLETAKLIIENQRQTGLGKKVVYRVLQSSSSELTQMISTLSECWRLEQIISLENREISSSYSKNDEYLVVVSQEQSNSDILNNAALNNCNDKIKALSGSLSSHTIRNLGFR